MADRAEQHAAQGTAAVAADNQERGILGLLEQSVGRPVEADHPVDHHVGVALATLNITVSVIAGLGAALLGYTTASAFTG